MHRRFLIGILLIFCISSCGGGSSGTGFDGSTTVRIQFYAPEGTTTSSNFSITILETGQTLSASQNKEASLELPDLDGIHFTMITPHGGRSFEPGFIQLVFNECDDKEVRINEVRFDYVDRQHGQVISGYRLQWLIDGKAIASEAGVTCDAGDCFAIFDSLIPPAPPYTSVCEE